MGTRRAAAAPTSSASSPTATPSATSSASSWPSNETSGLQGCRYLGLDVLGRSRTQPDTAAAAYQEAIISTTMPALISRQTQRSRATLPRHPSALDPTLGTSRRAFTHGHIQPLDEVNAGLAARLTRQVPGLLAATGESQIAFLDLDGVVREIRGYAKVCAAFGYTGQRGFTFGSLRSAA